MQLLQRDQDRGAIPLGVRRGPFSFHAIVRETICYKYSQLLTTYIIKCTHGFQLKKTTVCGLVIYSIHRQVSRFKGTMAYFPQYFQIILFEFEWCQA